MGKEMDSEVRRNKTDEAMNKELCEKKNAVGRSYSLHTQLTYLQVISKKKRP